MGSSHGNSALLGLLTPLSTSGYCVLPDFARCHPKVLSYLMADTWMHWTQRDALYNSLYETVLNGRWDSPCCVSPLLHRVKGPPKKIPFIWKFQLNDLIPTVICSKAEGCAPPPPHLHYAPLLLIDTAEHKVIIRGKDKNDVGTIEFKIKACLMNLYYEEINCEWS